MPCRGWIEDVRGEPGAEETLCHLAAAGRWEGPSPQEPALAPFSAATSAKGLLTRGPGAAERLALSDLLALFGHGDSGPFLSRPRRGVANWSSATERDLTRSPDVRLGGTVTTLLPHALGPSLLPEPRKGT